MESLRESFDAACRTVGWLAVATVGLLFVLVTYRLGAALQLAAGGAW
jgi:hypothetical protein